MDKQTSDERLLKLIEGAGEKHKQIHAGWPKQPFGKVTAKLNLFELKSKLKSLKIDLVSINKGLVALAILVTLILLYAFFSGPVLPRSDAIFFTPSSSQAILKLIFSGDATETRRSISQENIRRNFFLPPGAKSTSEAQGQDEAADLTEETSGDFKLVGIIWSATPEVMIENARDTRTYTLKKGDSLDGQFKVKEISRNSATLELVTEDGQTKLFEIR